MSMHKNIRKILMTIVKERAPELTVKYYKTKNK